MNLILELFFTFLKIGLFSIGGGYATLPLIQQQAVVVHPWLTLQEFTDIITLSQMTPGPLAVNTSTFVGMRLAGMAGAIAATGGCVLCGILISLGLQRFFRRNGDQKAVLHLLETLKSASVGLIAASAATIVLIALFGVSSWKQPLRFNGTALILFALSLAAIVKGKLGPVPLLILSALAGCFFYL